MLNAFYVSLCIAAPLLLMLFIQQEKKSRLLILFLLFGILSADLSGVFNSLVAEMCRASDFETALYVAPLVEEMLKALPVIIFFLLVKPDFKTIIGLGVAVGVGFATIENIQYLFAYGTDDIVFILVRGFSTGIMHAMTVSILAAALVFISRSRITLMLGAVGMLSVSISMHSIYNLLVNGLGFWPYVGYFLPVCVALVYLFLLYHFKMREGGNFGG
ncbi:MAG TPA: PrsW family glutamic-type intramembrane protease [Methanocorpusculum sp.]|nr:PrsW family glutamic-type intramembrane protease [Methanocorpusculum sp.]